jgi:cytochrome P450
MPIVTELDLPVLDYTAPDLVGEVFHRRLAEIAGQGWLAQGPLSFVVLDRESVEFFLRSRATVFPGRQIADMFGVTQGRLREQIDANILNQSGPGHRRLRALVGPAFTPRAADRWRPAMREFLAHLWDEEATSHDFVEALARPYPALTIAAVLGAPAEDAPRLHEWSNWVQRQFDIRALADELPRMTTAVAEVYDYVEALLTGHDAATRDTGSRDDLVGRLLSAEEEGDRLSHTECGGIDTTQAQLSHALRLFAEHPTQWARLAADPALAGQAVDEVLRHEPITPFTARICVEQVEHRGVIFPAGTIVAVCQERANREIEDGDDFDITAHRDTRPLTFGAGAHFCLGANLARAELEEALTFLAPRMPDLSPNGEPGFGGIEGIYDLRTLPLRWSLAI